MPGVLDEWMVYDTLKCVRIHSRKLATLYYATTALILLYVFISAVLEKGFLEHDQLVGNVRVSVGFPTDPLDKRTNSYCEKGCALWDEDDVVSSDPNEGDSVFLTTSFHDDTSERVCFDTDQRCTSMYSSKPKGPRTYVAGIENFRLKISHATMTPQRRRCADRASTVANRSGWLNWWFGERACENSGWSHNYSEGELLDVDGIPLRTFHENPGKRDKVTLGELLAAAGVSLDDLSDLHTNGQGERKSLRETGLVLLVSIEYSNLVEGNVFSPLGRHRYTYKVACLPEQKYKLSEPLYKNDTHKTVRKTNGVKVIFSLQGTSSRLSLHNLILHLAGGVGLLALATTVIDMLAIYVLKEKERTFSHKYNVFNENGVKVLPPTQPLAKKTL